MFEFVQALHSNSRHGNTSAQKISTYRERAMWANKNMKAIQIDKKKHSHTTTTTTLSTKRRELITLRRRTNIGCRAVRNVRNRLAADALYTYLFRACAMPDHGHQMAKTMQQQRTGINAGASAFKRLRQWSFLHSVSHQQTGRIVLPPPPPSSNPWIFWHNTTHHSTGTWEHESVCAHVAPEGRQKRTLLSEGVQLGVSRGVSHVH